MHALVGLPINAYLHHILHGTLYIVIIRQDVSKACIAPPGGSGSGQKWATASSYVRPPVGLPPAQFIIRRIPRPLFALSRAELFASVRTARTRRAPARARPSQGLFQETSRNISRLFLLQNCFAVNLSEMICKLTVFCYVGKVKPTSSYL